MTNRTDRPRGETALVFRRAAQILQARGHNKGLYESRTGEVCAVGALMAATGVDPKAGPMPAAEVPEAVWFLSSRLWVAIGDDDPIERVAEWNDKPERTQAEVVAELLSAARDIEAREDRAVVPTQMRTSDGAVFELASIPAHGDPRYVLAGCPDAPASVFAEYGELVSGFGAAPAGGASCLT